MIKIAVNETLDVTIFSVSGLLKVEDLSAAMKDAFHTNPTSNAIYDLTKASVSDITVEALYELFECSEEFALSRKNPRSTIVSGNAATMSIARLFQAITDSHSGTVKIQTADSLDAALNEMQRQNPVDIQA